MALSVIGLLRPLISKMPHIPSPKGSVNLFHLHWHRLCHSPQSAILQSASLITGGLDQRRWNNRRGKNLSKHHAFPISEELVLSFTGQSSLSSTPSVNCVSQSKVSQWYSRKMLLEVKIWNSILKFLSYLYQNSDTKLTEMIQTLEVEVTVIYTVGKPRIILWSFWFDSSNVGIPFPSPHKEGR